MNPATTQPPLEISRAGVSRSQLVLVALTLLALWFVLCRQLSGEWSVNEQYSYGWFVPFFAAFLFWQRWEDRGEIRKEEGESRKLERSRREPSDVDEARRVSERARANQYAERGSKAKGEWSRREPSDIDETRRVSERARVNQGRRWAIAIGMVALLILFPVRLFEVANPDWRPVDWVHTAAVATLTLLVIWAAGGWPWVRHFAFPVCFFFVAVPWISPIEDPVVQGLMRGVAALATETITLFGIPAQLEGNLIRVQTGLVGVNEACSGVRSLQTSLMIGLLFGELKRLSVAKRCLLVLGALAIAILANFGRAFFLVWVAATQSISAVDRWHDFAGYTIVAVVFIGSLLLTAFLNRDKKVERRKAKGENKEADKKVERRNSNGESKEADNKLESRRSKGESEEADKKIERRNSKGESKEAEPFSVSPFRLSPFPFLLSIAWLLAIELGVEGWYRMHERGLVAREQWSARWPERAKDFRDIHLDEKTRRILRFDEGRGATWKIAGSEKSEGESRKWKGESGTEDSALLYFFRWRPGSNSALLANVHRPDVCLPASGWIQVGDYGVRSYVVSPTLSLPFRHFLFSQSRPGPGNGARTRFAHAFYCLREDRVRGESGATPAREEFAQAPSDWSRRERVSLVVQGRRHLGQQVMEFVVIAAREISPDEAEARFAAVLPGIVEEEIRK